MHHYAMVFCNTFGFPKPLHFLAADYTFYQTTLIKLLVYQLNKKSNDFFFCNRLVMTVMTKLIPE